MPSSDPSAFHDDGIRDSLVLIASLIHKSSSIVERQFRRRLAAIGLTPEQRRLMGRLTPGAAARTVERGGTVRAFFADAAAAARELALCEVERESVLKALRAYARLIDPLIEKEPSSGRDLLRAARTHLNSALRLVIQEAFCQVSQEELGILRSLLAAEGEAQDVSGLADAMLGAIVTYFHADGGVWYRPDETALIPLAAQGVEGGAPPAHMVLARTLLHRLRVLDPTDRLEASAILVQAWRTRPGVIWSVPAGEGILQFRFEAIASIRPRQRRTLRMAGQRCTTALERLEREQRLRFMSLQMLEVEELERRHIARELHDDAAQSLVVARLHLELVELVLPPDATEARKTIGEIRTITEKTILGMRKLISDLSPAVLAQLGLGAAVRQLTNRFRSDYPVGIRLYLTNLPRLDPRLEVVVYRVLQECFSNISRHSRARRVNVSLTPTDRVLRLTVEDDGIGFKVEEGLGRRNCFGLLGIRQRVSLIGGKFLIESTPGDDTSGESPGGTRILVEFPLTVE